MQETVLSNDPLPSGDLPGSSFSPVGTTAVIYSRSHVGTQDFGLGPIDPYGGQTLGNFIALREVGGTRWARSPLSDELIVAGASSNILLAAFKASQYIDLDGTPFMIAQPTVFLSRLAY